MKQKLITYNVHSKYLSIMYSAIQKDSITATVTFKPTFSKNDFYYGKTDYQNRAGATFRTEIYCKFGKSSGIFISINFLKNLLTTLLTSSPSVNTCEYIWPQEPTILPCVHVRVYVRVRAGEVNTGTGNETKQWVVTNVRSKSQAFPL